MPQIDNQSHDSKASVPSLVSTSDSNSKTSVASPLPNLANQKNEQKTITSLNASPEAAKKASNVAKRTVECSKAVATAVKTIPSAYILPSFVDLISFREKSHHAKTHLKAGSTQFYSPNSKRKLEMLIDSENFTRLIPPNLNRHKRIAVVNGTQGNHPGFESSLSSLEAKKMMASTLAREKITESSVHNLTNKHPDAKALIKFIKQVIPITEKNDAVYQQLEARNVASLLSLMHTGKQSPGAGSNIAIALLVNTETDEIEFQMVGRSGDLRKDADNNRKPYGSIKIQKDLSGDEIRLKVKNPNKQRSAIPSAELVANRLPGSVPMTKLFGTSKIQQNAQYMFESFRNQPGKILYLDAEDLKCNGKVIRSKEIKNPQTGETKKVQFSEGQERYVRVLPSSSDVRDDQRLHERLSDSETVMGSAIAMMLAYGAETSQLEGVKYKLIVATKLETCVSCHTALSSLLADPKYSQYIDSVSVHYGFDKSRMSFLPQFNRQQNHRPPFPSNENNASRRFHPNNSRQNNSNSQAPHSSTSQGAQNSTGSFRKRKNPGVEGWQGDSNYQANHSNKKFRRW